MRVSQLTEFSDINCIVLADGEREINDVYIGDLLSWVMGRAPADSAWVTIMSNLNIVAVATLADVSCIILAEGVSADEALVNTAREKGINLLSTPLTAAQITLKLFERM
jgi:hypothetical protein